MSQTNRPLFKAGDVAVWSPREGGGKKLYSIGDGPKDGDKTYTSVFVNVSGHDLTPEEACKLYLGEEIEVDLPSTREEGGTYRAILAARGVNESPRTVGDKTYTNRTLDVGILLPLRKRDDGAELFGYKVRGVTYFRSVGSPDEPVTLDAKDVLQLAADKDVKKDGVTISVSEIKENEHGRTARVRVAGKINKAPAAASAAESLDEILDEMPDLDTDAPVQGRGSRI